MGKVHQGRGIQPPSVPPAQVGLPRHVISSSPAQVKPFGQAVFMGKAQRHIPRCVYPGCGLILAHYLMRCVRLKDGRKIHYCPKHIR